jgi:hypothetical protein
MGCGQTLFLGAGGYITCSYIPCPRPSAVDELLDDYEIEHIVEIDKVGFTARHPLRERLDNALLDCNIHHFMDDAVRTYPLTPGRYRARQDELGEWRLSASGGAV